MEVQLTDYENAAHAVFIVLLTRAIMNLGLNFYLPISKVRPSSLSSDPQSKSYAAGGREHAPSTPPRRRAYAEVLLPQKPLLPCPRARL